MIGEILAQLGRHRTVVDFLEQNVSLLEQAAVLIADVLESGNKLLVMGNGGSAGDSQHFAAEIVGRFKMERRGLPAIALTTDTSILTAVANDYGFEQIFSRQVEALADPGDVVVGISTSGNSPNVLKGLELARSIGCRTIGLLGRDGGAIKGTVDLDITIPGDDTARIQEGHITVIHIICDLIERRLFA